MVLSRGIIHAAGPYTCENVLIEGKAVLTNSVPYGAFRGFGAPQTIFACERHMDRIAHALGLDPVEVRRINLLKDGQTTSTQQTISGGTDRHAMLNETLRVSNYDKHKQDAVGFNNSHPYLRRGIGIATVLHGAGFTGNGEVYLNSKVDVGGCRDGKIEVLHPRTKAPVDEPCGAPSCRASAANGSSGSGCALESGATSLCANCASGSSEAGS